ncbi:MAG: PatA/PatG family cyanobactin maturation protease [Okeania sp. SIO3H1]|uniref:S8 family peptidase n=1 Tax=Okeania sp. SIO1I7 TaxID=2607772 RepID=UPI0013CD4AD7|nr:PatA/PatG family cyanobactin maturation protease [Okeania sp. SIO1I7]NEN90447.1 PatA/PatG family cyanobactin maturation protease [Okeania sp. SIO3H1]NET29057.1 PatA/PatG family cyanobactin maturation protease [Okeania sp. SIO1I7]
MPDFADIPGLNELWTHTRGDPRITVALLDGAADLDRGCFQGANVTKINPYWQQPLEFDPKYIDIFREIQNLDQKNEVTETKLKEAIPDKLTREVLGAAFHATHVFSNIFGQPGTPVEGIAYKCRGINIPIGYGNDYYVDPINLARAINLAVDLGANIIHCAACRPSKTGVAHELLEKAVRQALENNILIVAPTGNNKGECWCLPAILPGVMSVGAMKDNGQIFKFSNWGGQYQKQGIIAPGENILGAQPGTEETVRNKGTSCAAPMVTGISALLMSLQLQQGATPDAEAIRAALTNSAIPCTLEDTEEVERCMLGKLNVAGAFQLLTGKQLAVVEVSTAEVISEDVRDEVSVVAAQENTISPLSLKVGDSGEKLTNTQTNITASSGLKVIEEERSKELMGNQTPTNDPVEGKVLNSTEKGNDPTTIAQPTNGIIPSATSNKIYALGTVGYDFGTEARRDSFKQLMPATVISGVQAPANPYDASQMVDYLETNLYEAKSLIWTLNIELTPIYVLQPVGAFAEDIYETLQNMLSGQVEAEDNEGYIERVSITGRLSDETVKLFSGQTLPVVKIYSPRGMYGWTVNMLIDSALTSVSAEREEAEEEAIRKSLRSFLQRVYYDLRNLGRADRDRAINFAATNAFQATASISEAVAVGMELHSIEVEKSPFCRYNSNCWDVKLKFFNPDNTRRAKKVYRFTIDVSDLMPVTLGKVRSWSVSE